MTLHYHGTPITPTSVLEALAGRCFCVSWATGQHQVERCHSLGQSVMLDNGAFTYWKRDESYCWADYYDWVRPWLDYQTTWAVIPDVIDGSEEENDLLLASWFQTGLKRGAPVWHLHESLDRLQRLCNGYERVCIGSSGQYAVVGTRSWHHRMEEAMNRVCRNGVAPTWLHMLRGMAVVDAGYPFASVDSTDIARNHNRGMESHEAKAHRAQKMAARWDGKQAPARWAHRSQLELTDN